MGQSSPIRIVIAGGGTGGHVQPAIAVVEELRTRGIVAELLWIGGTGDVEGPAARRAGIPFAAIQTGKLRRYIAFQTAIDAFKIPVGVVQAWRLLRRFLPDVILSTGGFVSVPTVVAGSRIAPILTHEQTAILGLANRINLRFADLVALSFDQTAPLAARGGKRIVVTGNPVRASLRMGDAARGRMHFGFSPDLPLLYVTGGARVATPINERIAALAPGLLETTQVLHQAGPRTANDDVARLLRQRDELPERLRPRWQIVEFVGPELPDVYAAASLVLGRAGAGTVAELTYLGKPAVLIPLPLSGGGEQDENARVLTSVGAALAFSQTDATPDRLNRELIALLAHPDRLKEMGAAAKRLARPDAAARLADELLSLAARHAPAVV